MNRREFLKVTLSAAALAAVPASVVDAFVNEEMDTLEVKDENGKGVIFNYADKTVKLIPHEDGYTITELYRYVLYHA